MADMLFKRSWTDVIFQGKNQAYGAYQLRSIYNKNINRALIIAVILFSSTISLPLIINKLDIGKKEEPKNVEINLELLPPPPVDPKQPPPPPPPKIEIPKVAAAVKFLPPKVEEDEKVQDEEPPTIDEMKDKVISTQNIEGEVGLDNIIEEPAPLVEEEKEEVFLVVEEMPEFPGGMAAMQKFISSNIKYPRAASAQGLEGRVIVTFVINGQGEVDKVEVVKGIGGGCDEEAVRVVKMLPKWKPGRQNGRPVSVKFTVPIKFALN
jgi:protein TonB